jgi:hypothetical protein
VILLSGDAVRRFVIDEPSAAVVRRIFDEYLAERTTLGRSRFAVDLK